MSARLQPLRGTAGQLVRALARLIDDHTTVMPMYPMLVLEQVTTHPWSSATFEGERHRLELKLYGSVDGIADAAACLSARLPDAEFDLSGQIVAEARLLSMAVDPDDLAIAVHMTIEVVTVID